MIDLHCHLLPGVDDGAEDLDEALELARIAVADGIRLAVLTPHIHPGRYDNRRSQLLGQLLRFQQHLDSANIPLQLRLGGEVRLGVESLELLSKNEVPFLGVIGGYRVILLELPHQMIPVGSLQFVEKLLSLNIRPLIAHPERNKAVMAQPERIRPFVAAGCWLQLTAGAIAGKFGESAATAARYLLQNDLAYVIASDAHNREHRPPVISEGRRAAAEIVGEKMASEMVSLRPAHIVGAV